MKPLHCWLLASIISLGALPPPPEYFPSHGTSPEQEAKERAQYKKEREKRPSDEETPIIPTTHAVEGYYFQPGVVGVANGQWTGSDNLYNLPDHLSVEIEIHYELTDKDPPFPLKDSTLRKIVEDSFAAERINTRTKPSQTQAYLPFFHILVLVTPIEQGFTVLCAGRLFEEVQIARIRPTKDITIQAITWERQALIAASTNKTAETVSKAVEAIANDFANQFRYFSRLK